MNEFQTYEYVVAKKKEGVYKFARLLMIAGYIFYVVAAFVIGITIKLAIPLLALVPISLCIIVFFTWRYVSIEYEYSMVSGTVTFSEIYGGRSRKQKFEFRIKDCVAISPYSTESGKRNAENFGSDKTFCASSSLSSDDAYYAAIKTEEGEKILFIFEATEKALKILKFYNPVTEIIKVSK